MASSSAMTLCHVTLIILTCHLSMSLSAAQSSRVTATNIHLVYDVIEESKARTLVGDIKADVGLKRRYRPDIFDLIRFVMLTQDATLTELFTLDEGQGKLRTNSVIDRDQMCASQVECAVTLEFAIQPHDHFEVVKVTVKILDINDNAPAFPHQRSRQTLSESSLPGLVFPLLPARDPDSPDNGVARYHLFGTNDMFELQVHSNVDGTKDLRLILSRQLDRETQDKYSLQLVAYDGGQPRLSGTQQIDITITDINDNSPVFDRAVYELSVYENAAVNSTLLRIHATDADAEENGKVTYVFTRRTLQQHGDMFALDLETGDIILRRPLDYERQKLYNLDIVAQDGGRVDAISTPGKIIMHVSDLNDNPPRITVTGTAHDDVSTVVSVPEHSPPGSFVAHISVNDLDSEQNGQVTCSITADAFQLERMFDTEYKLVTTAVFDRELRPSHDVALRCHDNGMPRHVTVAQLTVVVGDVNDQAPVFQHDNYAITFRENNHVGDFLLRVTASDRDTGDNAMLKYEIVERQYADAFQVDSRTGIITAGIEFDRETQAVYEFHVTAVDHGVPPLSAVTMVIVSISDEDDLSPKFMKSRFEFEVLENESPVYKVGSLTAEDLDAFPHNAFTFRLEEGQSEGHTFTVLPDGSILTQHSLDREEKDVYEFRVKVASDVTYGVEDTAVVIVRVLDTNDNSPIVTWPEQANQTIHISNRLPVGYSLAAVKAEDADTGTNAQLIYALSERSKPKEFRIDPGSGQVIVSGDLTQYVEKIFSLHIIVADRGHSPRSTAVMLYVIVDSTVTFTELRSDVTNAQTLSSWLLPALLAIAIGAIVIIVVLLLVVVGLRNRRVTKYAGVRLAASVEHKSVVNSTQSDAMYTNSLTRMTSITQDHVVCTGSSDSSGFEEMQNSCHSPTSMTSDNMTSLRYSRGPVVYSGDMTSPFSDWLTSENYNLQQRGHVYRIGESATGSLNRAAPSVNKKSVHFFPPEGGATVNSGGRLSYVETDRNSVGSGIYPPPCTCVTDVNLVYTNTPPLTQAPPLSSRPLTTFGMTDSLLGVLPTPGGVYSNNKPCALCSPGTCIC